MISQDAQALLDWFERYMDAKSAKRRIVHTLAWWRPLQESYGQRGLTRFVSRRNERRPDVPFGWTAEVCWDRNGVDVGPAWFILPRRWYRELRWKFYHYAIRWGAAEGPEGCYYHELKWFNAQKWSL